MNQKYHVLLSETERYQLKQIISSGKGSARQIRRANILLKSDSSEQGPNWTYQAICEAFDVSQMTVTQVRKDYVERGLDAALQRKQPEREYEYRLDGEGEAQLIALACGQPPEGYQRWSMRLLKKKFVQMGYVDNISHETIRTTLKKRKLSLG